MSNEKRILTSVLSACYDLVDRERWDELFELFHPEIVYERGGTPPIRGIDELRSFYLSERVIAHGKHELSLLVVSGDWGIARGKLEGRLKTGEDVVVHFADFHKFRGARIWRRYTYFADRSV